MLTPDTWKAFAASRRLSPVLLEHEFESDMKIPNEINKNLTRLTRGTVGGNRKILINDVVTFCNLFHLEDARTLMFYLVHEHHHDKVRSVFKLLGVVEESYDADFFQELLQEINV